MAVCRSAPHRTAQTDPVNRLYQPGVKPAGINDKSAWDTVSEVNMLADRTLKRATGDKGSEAVVTAYDERRITPPGSETLYATRLRKQQQYLTLLSWTINSLGKMHKME